MSHMTELVEEYVFMSAFKG